MTGTWTGISCLICTALPYSRSSQRILTKFAASCFYCSTPGFCTVSLLPLSCTPNGTARHTLQCDAPVKYRMTTEVRRSAHDLTLMIGQSHPADAGRSAAREWGPPAPGALARARLRAARAKVKRLGDAVAGYGLGDAGCAGQSPPGLFTSKINLREKPTYVKSQPT